MFLPQARGLADNPVPVFHLVDVVIVVHCSGALVVPPVTSKEIRRIIADVVQNPRWRELELGPLIYKSIHGQV